jgi:hypothetical protein
MVVYGAALLYGSRPYRESSMRNIFKVIAVLMFVANVYAADVVRTKTGWGSSLTTSTTINYVDVEQAEGSDVVLNGTFANTNSWNTNTLWAVTGGAAVFTGTTGVQTDTIYQAISSLVTGTVYRVKYTISGIDPTTNNCTPYIGSVAGTTRTNDGTFTEDIPFVNGNLRLSFTGITTNAGAFSIDDVSLRTKPDLAYIEKASFYTSTTALPVYLCWNCNAATATNIFATSKGINVLSNMVTEIESRDYMPIQRIWYKASSGTPTLTINGN